MPMDHISFESRHFTIEPLAEGVFGAVHREGGWAIANAGIVDLGESCLVFDTFLTPAAGADLRRAAETLTGVPVRYVINSHYHNDHIWGNQAFAPEAIILSSAKSQRLIETNGQEEYDWYLENSTKRLAELEKALEEASNEEEKDALKFWISYYQALAESMPGLELRWPDLTFKSELKLRGAERQVELLAFNLGHTGGDTILHIPGESIMFTADLLFVGSHPYLPDGEPAALLDGLKVIRKMEPEILFPGHGPVGGLADLEAMIQYVHKCEQIAIEMVEAGLDLQEHDLVIPEVYASWEYPNFFQANVAHFIQEHRLGD